MKNILRRLLIGISLLVSLCGVRAAYASDCQAAGTLSITLRPCPVVQTVKADTPTRVAFTATLGGHIPGEVFVLANASTQDFEQGSLSGNFVDSTQIVLSVATSPTIAAGVHSGSMDVKICLDSHCSTVLVDVQLPYKLTVVVPPTITKLTPASVLVGSGAFNFTVSGRAFPVGSKIRFGNTVLTTTVVSSAELTAKMSLSAVTKGQTYAVSVVPLPGNFPSNSQVFTLKNPLPVITKLTPASGTVMEAPFTLTVTGKGFVNGSKIKLGSTALTTKYVSAAKLTATLDLSSVTAGAAEPITVASPTPGGGTSAVMDFALNNAAPAITSISPSWTDFVKGFKTFTVNGSGFQQNSVISWNGTLVPFSSFHYVSPTQLSVTSPSLFSLGTAGNATLVVTNPAPGGGISNPALIAIATPEVFWISPVRAYTGSGDITITLEGFDFTADTSVEWGGVALQVTKQTSNILEATVPAVDLAGAGTFTVSVERAGMTSINNSQTFTVVLQPPEIASLSPGFTAPGSGSFTLTVFGTDFDPAATVDWNGSVLTTTYVSASELQATVPAADVAAQGTAAITVANPASVGGTSQEAVFAVDTSGTLVVPMAAAVNDVEWDPDNAIFYGSEPNSGTTLGNLLKIDPLAAKVVGSQTVLNVVQSEFFRPSLLSRTSDGEFLYVGGTTWVERYSLPDLTFLSGFEFQDGSTVSALAASPRFAHVVAAIGMNNNVPEKLVVADGGESSGSTAKAWDSLAWSADGSALYAGDGLTSTDFSSIAYDIAGSQPAETITPSLWSGGQMHLDSASGLIFADGSTSVLDPQALASVGTLPLSGVMVPDSVLGCVYIIAQTPAQVTAAAGDWTLSCYSSADYTTLTRSTVIASVNGIPIRMKRWGNEGLVFITDGGYIYFVSGQVVTGN